MCHAGLARRRIREAGFINKEEGQGRKETAAGDDSAGTASCFRRDAGQRACMPATCGLAGGGQTSFSQPVAGPGVLASAPPEGEHRRLHRSCAGQPRPAGSGSGSCYPLPDRPRGFVWRGRYRTNLRYPIYIAGQHLISSSRDPPSNSGDEELFRETGDMHRAAIHFKVPPRDGIACLNRSPWMACLEYHHAGTRQQHDM